MAAPSAAAPAAAPSVPLTGAVVVPMETQEVKLEDLPLAAAGDDGAVAAPSAAASADGPSTPTKPLRKRLQPSSPVSPSPSSPSRDSSHSGSVLSSPTRPPGAARQTLRLTKFRGSYCAVEALVNAFQSELTRWVTPLLATALSERLVRLGMRSSADPPILSSGWCTEELFYYLANAICGIDAAVANADVLLCVDHTDPLVIEAQFAVQLDAGVARSLIVRTATSVSGAFPTAHALPAHGVVARAYATLHLCFCLRTLLVCPCSRSLLRLCCGPPRSLLRSVRLYTGTITPSSWGTTTSWSSSTACCGTPCPWASMSPRKSFSTWSASGPRALA